MTKPFASQTFSAENFHVDTLSADTFQASAYQVAAGASILGGTAWPSVSPGVSAGLGSYYTCTTDGTWWQKTVGDDTAWVQLRTFAAANGEDSTLTRGTPVCLLDGQLKRASASSLALSLVLGIVVVGAGPTLVTQVIPLGLATMTVDEWDAVTGQTGGLTPGASYFLDEVAGQLTTTPPSIEGLVLARVGHAISAVDMLVAPQPPIQL